MIVQAVRVARRVFVSMVAIGRVLAIATNVVAARTTRIQLVQKKMSSPLACLVRVDTTPNLATPTTTLAIL